MRCDTMGQAALVDSIIFMILLLLASGIILGSAGSSPDIDSGLQQYASDFTDTLLAMEVGENNKPVTELLLDQAILDGQSNFTDINMAILDAGNALVRPGLGYAISSQDIFLSSFVDELIIQYPHRQEVIGELPADRQASQRKFMIQGSQIDITIYMWVIE